MKAIYEVPQHPCMPNWNIGLYLFNKHIKQENLKQCAWQECENEFVTTHRQDMKEYCCESCKKKSADKKLEDRRQRNAARAKK